MSVISCSAYFHIICVSLFSSIAKLTKAPCSLNHSIPDCRDSLYWNYGNKTATLGPCYFMQQFSSKCSSSFSCMVGLKLEIERGFGLDTYHFFPLPQGHTLVCCLLEKTSANIHFTSSSLKPHLVLTWCVSTRLSGLCSKWCM